MLDFFFRFVRSFVLSTASLQHCLNPAPTILVFTKLIITGLCVMKYEWKQMSKTKTKESRLKLIHPSEKFTTLPFGGRVRAYLAFVNIFLSAHSSKFHYYLLWKISQSHFHPNAIASGTKVDSRFSSP